MSHFREWRPPSAESRFAVGANMVPVKWSRIVELARQIDDEHRRRNAVDMDIAMRLAHAIVTFQEQLVGTFRRSMRR